MSAHKYKTIARWPAAAGVPNNVSEDTHDTLESALAVRYALQSNGLGGNGMYYPTSVTVVAVITPSARVKEAADSPVRHSSKEPQSAGLTGT